MGKTRIGSSSHVKKIVAAIIVAFLVIAGFLLIRKLDHSMGRFPDREIGDPTLSYNGVEYRLKQDVETFLVIGIDKYDGVFDADSYNNDKQADFLMLFVLDNEKKTCTAVHINRDTIVDVNVLGVAGNKIQTLKKQIALSHTYGNGKDVSCRNTAESVSSLLLGMNVDHYASVTLETVPLFNDLVGGVEVTVLDDFSGIDDRLVKGETVLLEGDMALRYVRTRQGLEDSSNGARMVRQRQYINALYLKTRECIEKDDGFVAEASLKLSDYIVSDRSVTQLQTLAEKFSEYEFSGIKEIAGRSEKGEEYMEFYPDSEALEALVMELFYERAN